MKWYFALSERTLSEPQYIDLIRVAVATAVGRTTLRPFMLWDGGPCALTRALQDLGVTIVPCVTRFADLIDARWADPVARRIALGAFMRLEIPSIESEDELVLYTDCDVMFMKNPRLESFRPALFSVAPEFEFGNYRELNSGVMLMNVGGMRQEQAGFDDFVRSHFEEFEAFEQGAIKRYFAGRFDFLPPTLNWKPYWGRAESVEILHFHLKPYQIRTFAEKRTSGDIDHLRELYDRDPRYCRQVAGAWFVMADQARAAILPDSALSWPIAFDGLKYWEMNPDVAAAGVDPFEHYTTFGIWEGRGHPALEMCA
jgi:hypothetical protein